MKTVIFAALLLFIKYFCAAEDLNRPKAPVEPVRPIVPGATENTGYPKLPPLPSFPVIPNSGSRTNTPAREISRHELIVSAAFPNGDTRRNVADSIDNALSILYSNGTIVLKLQFKTAPEYAYHFINLRAKIETGPGIFRQVYDVTVQVGKEFLLEQYTGELYSAGTDIISASIFADNKVVVTLHFAKK